MMDNYTEFEKRKRDMMELWKETFHDSDSYISLVFDTYYSLENTFVRYHENRLIAAMLSVAYEFQILRDDEEKTHLKGMYLCGLATRPEWRNRGIMSELMEEAEEEARRRGFDLTFLIPADDHLRQYYAKKGYHTGSWRSIDKYISGYGKGSIREDDLHIYSVKDFLKEEHRSFIGQIAEWCIGIERTRRHNTMVHSKVDLIAAMAENENSIFITHSTFNPEYPILAKVVGLVFPELPKDENEPLLIAGLYTSGKEIVNSILEATLRKFGKKELDFYVAANGTTTAERVVPYAMVKRLRSNENFYRNEIATFEISLMLD